MGRTAFVLALAVLPARCLAQPMAAAQGAPQGIPAAISAAGYSAVAAAGSSGSGLGMVPSGTIPLIFNSSSLSLAETFRAFSFAQESIYAWMKEAAARGVDFSAGVAAGLAQEVAAMVRGRDAAELAAPAKEGVGLLSRPAPAAADRAPGAPVGAIPVGAASGGPARTEGFARAGRLLDESGRGSSGDPLFDGSRPRP